MFAAQAMLAGGMRIPVAGNNEVFQHSSICWLPQDEKLLTCVQEIRKELDPKYGMWPPHIKLLYPYVRMPGGTDDKDLVLDHFFKDRVITFIDVRCHFLRDNTHVDVCLTPSVESCLALDRLRSNLISQLYPTQEQLLREHFQLPNLTLKLATVPKQQSAQVVEYCRKNLSPLFDTKHILNSIVVMERERARSPFEIQCRIPASLIPTAEGDDSLPPAKEKRQEHWLSENIY